MDASETKKEIKKVIYTLPENTLIELLGFLRYLQKYPEIDITSVYQIKQIINENRELLQKLAH